MKITAIETQPVSITVTPDLSIVSSLGAHRISRYVVVIVRDDEGHVGYGEATVMPLWSGETQEGALAAIDKVLAPIMLGRDARDVSAAAEAMDKALIDNPFVKAAIEMALLDLVGKALGVPVTTLLGGARRSEAIPLKFSIGAFSPTHAANVAQSMADRGFRAVKVKVGLDVKTDIERVAAIRAAMGDNFPIGADANGGWNERQTVEALPHLERLGVNVLEQPLPQGRVPRHRPDPSAHVDSDHARRGCLYSAAGDRGRPHRGLRRDQHLSREERRHSAVDANRPDCGSGRTGVRDRQQPRMGPGNGRHAAHRLRHPELVDRRQP